MSSSTLLAFRVFWDKESYYYAASSAGMARVLGFRDAEKVDRDRDFLWALLMVHAERAPQYDSLASAMPEPGMIDVGQVGGLL